MDASAPATAPNPEAELLAQAQRYLANRETHVHPSHELEAAWREFYTLYLHKIRKYAFTCGAPEEELADCVQEVWTELLLRLPTFRLDPKRGKFDTWLFQIVRGKTANLLRSRRSCFAREDSETLQAVVDDHPSPFRTLEEKELVTLAWCQMKKCMSDSNFQVFQMRLVEDRPVAEVAEELGISHEQVWYRYHRARRAVEEIGSAWSRGSRVDTSPEENGKGQKSAQGKLASSVSRNTGPSSHARHGVNCVDYVFQRLELGRRELSAEWKVEWNCDGAPRPVLHIRKLAIVAYAEICGPGDFLNTHWQRIANAALAAGVSAGIATIIATPTAALPIFQKEFNKHLQSKGGSAQDEMIHMALSAKQEPNGPWCVCKE